MCFFIQEKKRKRLCDLCIDVNGSPSFLALVACYQASGYKGYFLSFGRWDFLNEIPFYKYYLKDSRTCGGAKLTFWAHIFNYVVVFSITM